MPIFVVVNRDDIDDLIVANSGNDEVLVYLGRIDGSFNATALPYRDNNPNDLRDGPSGITSADLNEDGYMDLIVTNFASNSVSLLLNKGTDTDGRWEGFTLESRLDVGLGPVSTVVRDVTGDGLNDLLVTNSQAGTVELLPSTSDGLFNGRRDSVTLPGPTGRQGAVYGTHEAFVALADGSVVKFALDTFQTGQDFGRIVMQPRSGRAAISVVTALQPANIDGDVESELFVTGFDADGRAVTALFDNTSSIVFDELQRWAPAELVSPGDLVVLPASEGQFELFVAQDSVQVPFVRILTSTFAHLLPGTNSVTTVSLPFLALAALRFSDLTASTLDFDALSVSSVDELDGQYASVNSLKGLIEELVGTLNGAITNVLSGLSNLLHPLLRSVEEALGSQLADQVLTGLVDAVKDVVARSFPGLTAMELAWRILTDESIDLASPKESIASDRPPSTDAITVNEIIMELAENIRAMMRDYSVPALAQLDAKTARFFARQLRELVFETIAQVKKEFDVLPAELSLALPDERSWKLNQALNVIAASLFLAGTAGLLWHYFDRPRTAE